MAETHLQHYLNRDLKKIQIRTHDLCAIPTELSKPHESGRMRVSLLNVDVILGFSGLCSSSVTAALALMTVSTQLLLMDKINFISTTVYSLTDEVLISDGTLLCS